MDYVTLALMSHQGMLGCINKIYTVQKKTIIYLIEYVKSWARFWNPHFQRLIGELKCMQRHRESLETT